MECWLLKSEGNLVQGRQLASVDTQESSLRSRGQCGHCQEWSPKRVRCESEKASPNLTCGLRLQRGLNPSLRCPLCWKPDLYWAHGLPAPGGLLRP